MGIGFFAGVGEYRSTSCRRDGISRRVGLLFLRGHLTSL